MELHEMLYLDPGDVNTKCKKNKNNTEIKMSDENYQLDDTEIPLDVTTIGNLKDVFQSLQDSEVSKIIQSFSFDPKSQTFLFQMKSETENGKRQNISGKTSSDAKIIKISENYKRRYPELLDCFGKWKRHRENLLQILKSSPGSLKRNTRCVAGFRLLTSAVDMYWALGKKNERPENSWPNFTMEHASTLGMIALVIELLLCDKIQDDVTNAAKEDQRQLRNIIEWFQQTEELDDAIKSFFPYGIDRDIVKKIDKCSPDSYDYNKIFLSIVASNAERNPKLFKNKAFLGKAEGVATSEAGKLLFHKIIMENDPYVKHCLNSNICDEMQDELKSINQELSPTKNEDAYMEVLITLSNIVSKTVFINLITIMTASKKLLFGARPKVSGPFEKLSEILEKQLTAIENVVRLLKPCEIEIDPIHEE